MALTCTCAGRADSGKSALVAGVAQHTMWAPLRTAAETAAVYA